MDKIRGPVVWLFLFSLSLVACGEDVRTLKARAENLKDKVEELPSISDGQVLGLVRYGIGAVAVLSGSDANALFGTVEEQNPDLVNITNDNVELGVLAITERVTNCPGGGTITYVRDDQGPPWFSQGDTYTTTYADCVSGVVTTNGSRIFRVEEQQGQQWVVAPWSLTTSMERQAYTVSTPWGTRTVDGVSSISLSSPDNVVITQVNSGQSASTNDVAGETLMTTNDYVITHTWDEANNTFSLEFDVSTTGPIFDDVAVRTLSPLTGPINQIPTAGQAEIVRTSSAGNTSIVTATLMDNGLTRMEMDTNGDGVVDWTQDVNWTQLGIEQYLYQYF